MSAKTRVFTVLFVLCIFFIIPACTANAASIGLTVVPGAFNPSTGPANISYMLNDCSKADVSIAIMDNKSNIDKLWDASALTGLSGNVSWDGRLADGGPAPEGNYTIKALASTGYLSEPQFFLRWGQSLLTNGSSLKYYPYSPAADGKGNLYVTDGRRNCVLKFDAKGNFLLKWGVAGHGDGQFSDPAGIAVDGAGNVYVVDSRNNRVEKFDAKGRYLLQFGSYGTGDGQFNCPSGISLDSRGNVYVVDTRNNRVQYFDSNGTFRGKWGSSGSDEGMFDNPCGITVDAKGMVYVTDANNDRVQKFDLEGTYRGSLADHGLIFPSGITTGGSGELLVTDNGNHRMTVYAPDGSLQRQDYAPAGYVSLTGRSAGSLAFALGNGYLARWKPIDNDSERYVCLTERGCLRVTSLDPFTVGSAASFSATKNIVLDRTAPVIQIMIPLDGNNYGQYDKVKASWRASDSVSGLNFTKGTVADGLNIDTANTGMHEFKVQATDNAGNVGTLTCRYNVQARPSQTGPSTYVYVPSPVRGTSPTSTPVPGSGPDVVPGPIGAVVQLPAGGTQVRAEIARSSAELNQGLMYRTSMAPDRGMLFVFSGDGMHSFHMENTYIPLDMIFINSDLKIVNIHANAQPLSPGWISSESPCHYVLEVNGGFCSAHGISEGQTVSVTLV